jgi:translin
MSDNMTATTIVDQVVSRFDTLNSARDRAIVEGRQIIRLSANAVRALHRGAVSDAGLLLDEARDRLAAMREDLAPHPSLYWAGYVQDAMKEYAEARITDAVLRDGPLPDPLALGVEDAPFLNGLAEAASELRRDVLDLLRAGTIDRAERLLSAMDDIYSALVSVDYPDAITGGLRRTTDQLRAVLERTRGDLTLTFRQQRLEAALRDAQQRLDVSG